MNLYAFSAWQAVVAAELGRRLAEPVTVGVLCDITDSYHIYGRDIDAARRFLRKMEKRGFAERMWTTDDVERLG
jgi:hypothetical protein